jgi:hypothetical protein
MHNTKERLSLLWIFALLNYLYADIVALFAIAGTGPKRKQRLHEGKTNKMLTLVTFS